ncbi:uncharacterized protein LOC108162231 [Drosophila miranda]|nr:uncharacterized protein LOC108162231 [Drosophila miranda]
MPHTASTGASSNQFTFRFGRVHAERIEIGSVFKLDHIFEDYHRQQFHKMSHGERKGRLNVVKFLELGFAVACLVLHFYSFNDRDIMTSFLATGTFTGYIIVVIGVFAGVLMRAPIHKRIDIFFSVMGCALFVASGVFIIEAWEFSFRTRTRDLALIKASLSIVNGVLFGFDAIFTFRDK